MRELLGMLAVMASWTIIILGLPKQIRDNFRNKSTKGLSPVLMVSVFSAYVLWGLYAWVTEEMFVLAPQIPGAVLSSVILFQMWRYRRNGE